MPPRFLITSTPSAYWPPTFGRWQCCPLATAGQTSERGMSIAGRMSRRSSSGWFCSDLSARRQISASRALLYVGSVRWPGLWPPAGAHQPRRSRAISGSSVVYRNNPLTEVNTRKLPTSVVYASYTANWVACMYSNFETLRSLAHNASNQNNLSYYDRLERLNVPTLELRRLRADLL